MPHEIRLTLHESEAIMSHASPNPRAVVERSALAGGAVDVGDAIDAGGRAGSADKVTVQGAAHIPRVGLKSIHCKLSFCLIIIPSKNT